MNNTLIIGASLNENRYSNLAIRKLLSHGYPVFAIGRKPGNIEGIEVETELILDKKIHTISLYINPQNQEGYYDYILNLNPKRIIFNPGTENHALAKKAKEASISVLNACTLVMLSTSNYF